MTFKMNKIFKQNYCKIGTIEDIVIERLSFRKLFKWVEIFNTWDDIQEIVIDPKILESWRVYYTLPKKIRKHFVKRKYMLEINKNGYFNMFTRFITINEQQTPLGIWGVRIEKKRLWKRIIWANWWNIDDL